MRPPPRALLNILLAGALLRLVGLAQHSLWLDEGATWSWAVRPTWGGTFFAEANHPPLWWLITRVWISWFGDGEAALRVPAALCGVATIFLAWRLGLRLLDPSAQPRRGGFPRAGDPGAGRRAALWFAGFVAASAYFIEYAQEARMYALLLLETVGLSLLYLRWLDKNDRASLVGYTAVAVLALHTQYFAIWPLAAHGAHVLYLGWKTRGQPGAVKPLPMVLAHVAAGVLFLPWLIWMMGHYEGISTGEPFEPFSRLAYVLWRIGAGPGLVVVDRARLTEGPESVFAEEALIVGITAALWFIPLVVGFIALRRRPGTSSYLLFQLLVPVLLVLAVFPVFPLVHERYLLFLAMPLILVATIGAVSARGVLRWTLLGALSVLFATGLAAYHGVSAFLYPHYGSGPVQELDGARMPARMGADLEHPLHGLNNGHPYGKEPWRQAHAFVEAYSRAAGEAGAERGDLVLLHPWYLHLVWDYYDRRRLDRVLLPQKALDAESLLAAHGEALRDRRRIFLVLAHEETENPDHYAEVLRRALVIQGLGSGAQSLRWIRPIWFDRSWGVRVAVFIRE